MSVIPPIHELLQGAQFAPLSVYSAAQGAQPIVNNMEWVSWALPVAAQIAILIYLLGGIKSQINALSGRIERIEAETERERDSYSRVDDRVHGIAISQAEVKILLNEIRGQVNGLCLEAAECPLAQGALVPRRKRKTAAQADAEGAD